ncbi:MAG: hypothetical protein KGH94_02115 [Candidatus Micrarchaeota archaeon]|nr:hypothetical protein [Candidatus Micrarchaeota archaeon]
MRPNEKVERELCLWIDCLVEEIGSLYRGDLTDENRIERMARDAALRDSLVEHLRQLIKLRVMSELFEDQGKRKSYILEVEVSPGRFSTRIR